MGLKEISRRVVPPIAIDAVRRLRKSRTPASATHIRFQYGQFFLECDSSHHLPEVLSDLPNFGRNLADVVGALETQEPHVIDVGTNIGDTAILLARFAPGAHKAPCGADSKRGYRRPCPRPHMSGNYLNIDHKK